MKTKQHRGSFALRLMILGFSLAVGVLTFWLLGYIIRDIDRIKGPDYDRMLQANLPPELLAEQQELTQTLTDLQRQFESTQERRRLIGQTIGDSQQTINQLLELKRAADQDPTQLDETQQQALTESLQLFLENQGQTQQLNRELASLNDQQNAAELRQRTNQQAIAAASLPIGEEYQRLYEAHQWKLAAYKLAVLSPLLIVCCWLFLRHAGGTYGMLVYAFGGAAAVRVLLVMHEHFPAVYFKYILILLSLAIATGVLVRLLRLSAHPSQQWLIKQYREAYATFFCPVCDFPIQRGPLKYAYWTRRSLKKNSLKGSAVDQSPVDEPYTCPSCETPLFTACEKCGNIRHSLLPACERCGAHNHALAS